MALEAGNIMELNAAYNGFDDHCKVADMDLMKQRKYIHKESHNLESIDHIMHRKDQQQHHQEFLDHASLLAPEYIRYPNSFIMMDLMNFPKGVVSSGTHPGDTLPADLHFHSSQLFPVTADEEHHQQHHHHHHHHSNEPRKSPTYLPLNSDFLMPVNKSFNAPVDDVVSVEENGAKVVQELLMNESNVNLDDGSIDDDCDISRFDSRKVLPHKKRISRKLKINHDDGNLQLNVPLQDHKLPHVEQLVVGAPVQQFRCELCGHVTCSQLDFFAHLKQHYEPSTPDTILAAMKTSLDALGPEKSEAASNLCSIDKKTDELDQVFQDVHFPFENFPQTDEVSTERRVDMDMQTHVDQVDMKVVYSNAMGNVASNNMQPQQTQQQQQQQQHQQQQQPNQNLVPEEFSDTEDMLEGIRDKVLIEDTCDTMDLMTPTSNGVRPHWFNNNCFNGIDLKSKPFCDVLFSGQFAPILNTDPPVPADNNHISVGKLMPKDLVDSNTQVMQHATDLRLQFPHANEAMTNSHEPQQQQQQPPAPQPTQQPTTLSNNLDLISPQHIKLEDNNDIPPFHTEQEFVANENAEDNEDDYDDDGHQDHDHSDESYSHLPKLNVENNHTTMKPMQPHLEDGEYDPENLEEEEEDGVEVDGNGKRKRYLCNKCQRVFNSCNALKYHMRTHSGLRPHQCDICDKSFFAIGALKAHTRTHTGDKPFECEICNRKFRQWGDLKYHTVSIHSSEKNHQCEFCGKAFSRKYSLVVHLRIHTSERNYKCEFCTKTFRASTYLQNHRKIHTGEKPYECEVCEKKFRVSGDLRRHQRIHERTQKKKNSAFKEQAPAVIKSLASSPPTT
uniref:C2H2-type domain-containing protein n=1 Tax=Stomoxys calcitrans TaxID=35570 RepID=A0A1I8PBT1_STOCA